LAADDRIWRAVDIGDCWLWTRSLSRAGYGRLHRDGRWWIAHRYVYAGLVGPIPEGKELDHLCRTPRCVNPDHLEPVTHRENMLRGQTFAGIQSRRTHCPKGHPYTPENTVADRVTHRKCRTCMRAYFR